MTLVLGLPSKGRLMEEAAAWLAARGVEVKRADERGYAARVRGLPGIEPRLLSASEIPRELALGRVHLGVTGSDLVLERLGASSAVEALAPMGFGHADLVIAVPAFWVDVETLDDLDDAAAAFRAHHGRRLRIATKYHRLVRERLTRAGVADYALVDSQGATEGTVAAGTAEAVADITSSGETLSANGLRPLADGLVHASQATLWRSRAAVWDDAVLRALAELRRRMEEAEAPATGSA